ncbi:very short patch repair endonuclease [Hydrogenovibrio thermophilus]|uniref:Very short patch repair endonuclease n=1 Tax=Hydrogenovibrio thermophilus TaxID=265883 RepID=A0A410H2P0_9GAMM|nr:DNA mismatch endonuclease Vsr [Hydrogenovibrio thermophilus]QAB15193.1 DNA mismatch endonuclease Vsr [Hydrogenovibrio thermophilus]
MVDSLTAEKRSWNMSRISNKDTKPELIVRKLLHKNGYRFRLHRKDLPGKPDLVLPKYKTVIFVHGCFWHMHEGCKDAGIPKTRTEFWKKKLEENVKRDKKNIQLLKKLGWNVIIVWECETHNSEVQLLARLGKELTRN